VIGVDIRKNTDNIVPGCYNGTNYRENTDG
jgi:hypothetical protein